MFEELEKTPQVTLNLKESLKMIRSFRKKFLIIDIIIKDYIDDKGFAKLKKVLQSCKNAKVILDLTDVKLLNSELPEWAFRDCYSLLSIKLPDTLESMGYGAFDHCFSLESVYMPDSVKKMEGSVFFRCKNLKNVKLSKQLERIKKMSFQDCESLSSLEIPDRVHWIEEYAFSGCKSLQRIELPKNTYYEDGTRVERYPTFGTERTISPSFDKTTKILRR